MIELVNQISLDAKLRDEQEKAQKKLDEAKTSLNEQAIQKIGNDEASSCQIEKTEMMKLVRAQSLIRGFLQRKAFKAKKMDMKDRASISHLKKQKRLLVQAMAPKR